MCIQHAFLDEKPASQEGLFPQSVKIGAHLAQAPQCPSGRTQMGRPVPGRSNETCFLVEDSVPLELNDSLNNSGFGLNARPREVV